MTAYSRTPVTVVGLGSMGRALAGAFVDAGHPTTVWNRTPGKAVPLVARGAVHAGALPAAIEASPLVVTCLTTFEDTRDVLEPAGAALAGRALVTLNSGSPAGARALGRWATGHGARFLAGAVKNVPAAVGAPDTLLYYGGDRTVFDEYETTLKVLGGDTVHLGTRPTSRPCTSWPSGRHCCPRSWGSSKGPPPSRPVGSRRAAWCRSPGSGWT